MREWSEIIIKPTVANGAIGVLRLKPEEYLTVRHHYYIIYNSTYVRLLQKGLPHIKKLLSQGYKVLAQPFISAVESSGEISALYFNEKFSHAVRKVPENVIYVLDDKIQEFRIEIMFVKQLANAQNTLQGDFRVQNEYGGVDFEYKPSQEELSFHERVLSAAKESVKAYSKQDYYKHDFLYARIDYFVTEDNKLLLSELEVMEPHLFLNIASDQSIPNWQNAVVDVRTISIIMSMLTV